MPWIGGEAVILELLANTAPATGNDTVSLAALGTFVSLVLGAVGAFLAKKKGKEEGKQEEQQRRVSIDGQPIAMKVDERFVTHSEFTAHMDRVESDITEIKESLDGERSIARTANGNIHKRIDLLSEKLGDRLSKLEGITESINKTTDKLLDIAIAAGAKPKGGKQ
jgi:LPXTG-motif cell wall-anchored protein